jgi:ornithine cyclodeaminase/alanine dehydrogenase-like protein (mu-crystallin family)
MPPRIAARVAHQGAILGAMPAYLPSAGALTSKLVTLFPKNAALGLHTHQAAIVAFDPETGTPLALMDGTYITAVRTAAGSALATRLLARPESSVLAILGTGVQAQSHARALLRERAWSEIRVAGRDAQKAQALADALASEIRGGRGVVVRAVATYADALAGADVACATTHSPEPVVQRAWVPAGLHINSVGLHPAGPEVDTATVVDALVVVESRQQALAPWPTGLMEIVGPIEAGLIGPEHIHAEIGEIVAGTASGRTDDDQITLYKSVGVAVQDAAAVGLLLDGARAARTVEL